MSHLAAPYVGAWWTGPRRISALPQDHRMRAVLVVMCTVGFAWLLTPRLFGPFTEHLHKEDGLIFLSGQQQGESLLTTYTGYLHVGPRAIVEVCALLPPESMTSCLAGGSALVRMALAILVVAVLTPYVRHSGWAVAAGAVALFGGVGQQEVLGNITNLRWFLDVAATFALLGAFRRWWSLTLAGVLLVAATLTDPLALLLAPVAVWRLIFLPGRARIVPAVFFPAALVHMLHLDVTARESNLDSAAALPLLQFQNIVVRSGTETILGETGSTAAVMLIGPLTVSLVTVAGFIFLYSTGLRRLDRDQRWMTVLLSVGGFLFLIATVNFADPTAIDVSHGVAHASRYALIPSVAWGAGLLVLLSEYGRRRGERLLRAAILTLMIIAAAVDSRGDEWATRGPTWEATLSDAEQRCGSPDAPRSITVPATPQGVPLNWTAELDCTWVGR